MFGLLFVVAVGVFTLWYTQSPSEATKNLPQKLSDKLDKLWEIAQDSLKTQRYLRAEKALLTILRIDERNATAYNRLGILYAKQRAYSDAIECFEIAQSLEPSASSLHNVGLIYFETENYEKAALAFEQALTMEETVASRHIAYAKVQEKLDRPKRMIEHLERAVELEPSVQSFNILADAYSRVGENEKAENLRRRVERAINSQNPPARRIKQPRRVAM